MRNLVMTLPGYYETRAQILLRALYTHTFFRRAWILVCALLLPAMFVTPTSLWRSALIVADLLMLCIFLRAIQVYQRYVQHFWKLTGFSFTASPKAPEKVASTADHSNTDEARLRRIQDAQQTHVVGSDELGVVKLRQREIGQ